ncbi:MAG: Sepiapterin reductase [Candidatus Heimdallarchaeota archaeon LC_3]|nr:MAG: Sepiapterin reductase [Candidatus Heimdallarchaeota archaeon LC_3]
MNNESKESHTKKIILITGASKGIGKAIAEKLGKNHILVLIARNLGLLERVKESVNSFNGQSILIQADVTNESNVKNCIQQVIKKYGTIDVLINNAGIGKFNRIEKFSQQDYHDIFNVNVLGTFLFTKYVVPIMIKKNMVR